MTQDQFRCSLQDYLDGLLADDERKLLEKRLEHDADLMADLDELRAIRDAAARLPESIQPGRDLWPGVAAGIAPPRRRWNSRQQGGFAFAAAVILLLASMLLWGERPEKLATDEDRGGSNLEIAAMERIISAAEIELAPAFAVASHEDTSPEIQPLKDAVQQLSLAVDESMTVWKKDPEDEAARRRLLRVNKQRVRFARRIINLQARI